METEVFKIDLGDTIDQIVKLKGETADLTEQNKELKKALEGGAEALEEQGLSAEEAAAQIVKNESALRLLKQETKEHQKAVDNLTKSEKAAKGSIEANRIELSRLTQEYIKLGKPTFEQTKRLNDLTNTLKRQESAIGNNSRNVGNYTESINKSLASIKFMNTDVGSLAAAFQASGASMKGATTSVRAFGTAVISTGIGALVVALGLLIANFDKVQKVLSENREEVNKFAKILVFIAPQIALIIKGIQFLQDNLAELQKILAGVGSVAETVFNAIASAADALLTLDFSNVKKSFANLGTDLAKAFNEGYKQESDRQAKEAADLVIKNEILLNKRRLNVLEAQGKDTFALRKKILEQELSLLAKGTEEYLDKLNEIEVITEAKKLEQLTELRRKSAEDLQKFIDTEVKKLTKAVDDIENKPVEIKIAGKLDVPQTSEELERGLKEVGTRLENFLKDEKSFLDALIGEEATEKLNENLAIAGGAVDAIGQITQVQQENALNAIEERRQAEIEAVERSVAEEEDKAEKIEQINKRFDEQAIRANKKYAEQQRRIQKVQAIINGAVAVTSALQMQPFIPVGIASAALAAVTTGVQIAAINAQKFAQGGEVPIDVGGKPHSEGGTTYIGEDGNAFEVEKGEKIFVMKTTASEEMDRYSKWNQLFGGNSWTGKGVTHAALGGSISSGKKYANLAFAPSFDGGLQARESRNNVESQLQIMNMPPIEVKVSEINRVQRNVKQSAGVSEM